MRDSTDPPRRTHSPRPRLLTLAALASGALVAGCGGSSPSPTVATVRSKTTSSSTAASNAAATTVPDTGESGPLAFARCMRANGVPNFPDPKPGGRLLFSTAGLNPAAPAFQSAQTKCQKYMGTPGGPGGPSFSPQVTAQSLAKLLKIARCMRAHGISEFPDPTTTRPSTRAGSGAGVITDFDGVFLAFPATFNLEAPAYKRALTACGAPPLGLPH